jgi:hypothetical protein
MTEPGGDGKNADREQEFSMKWRMSGLTPWIEKPSKRPWSVFHKALAAIFLIIFLFIVYIVLSADEYRLVVWVGEGGEGATSTAEVIDFGEISKETPAVRQMAERNGIFMPVRVVVLKVGDTAKMVDVSFGSGYQGVKFLKLKPQEEVRINLTASVPPQTETDNKKYTGRVLFFKVPTFGL